jgi:ribosomal protein S8
VSSPSKCYNISLKGLILATKSLGNSIIILETDKGIITHIDAIQYNIGGKLLGIIS